MVAKARVHTSMAGQPTARGIIRSYLAIAAFTTLAQSLIWGVNTLFLLDAGLDIFEVMIVNGAYSAGMLFFEVPTGVVADTVGRRISYLLSVAVIIASTLLYMWFGIAGYGVWPFILASVLLGLGYTFYTGAVDAWMVDALNAVGYEGPIDRVFARYGMVFGVSMLIGTTLGGLLGQLDLWIPYAVRAAFLIPAFAIGFLFMPELGYVARAFRISRFGEETRSIAKAGITYGLRDPVVRPLMLSTGVLSVFFMYGFYSWQVYFLELLGRNLVWVNGAIAAAVGLSQVAGNALVGPVVARFSRASIALVTVALQGAAVIAIGLTSEFWLAVGLYILSTTAFGVLLPVKQAWLNSRIPSQQRATIISLDALLGDGGAAAGQAALGYVSRAASIPLAWVIGGAIQLAALPLFVAARRGEARQPVAAGLQEAAGATAGGATAPSTAPGGAVASAASADGSATATAAGPVARAGAVPLSAEEMAATEAATAAQTICGAPGSVAAATRVAERTSFCDPATGEAC
jgi:MFS family permease